MAAHRSSARSATRDGTDAQTELYAKFIQPLGREPAFLFIFAICVVFGGALGSYGVVTQTPQAMYVGLIAFFIALVAAVGVVWIVVQQKKVPIRAQLDEGRQILVEPEKLATSAASAQSYDPSKYFIDSTHGFLFQRPNSQNWGKPELISGVSNILAARIDLDPETANILNQNAKLLPYAKMIEEQSLLRVKAGHALDITVCEDTTTDSVEAILENIENELRQNHSDKSEDEIRKELDALRMALVATGIKSMHFSNEFCITWFDKSKLTPTFKPSLATIFLQSASALLNMARELKTNENSIILTGKMDIKNVLIGGKKNGLFH